MKYYAYTAVLCFLLSPSKSYTLHQEQSVPLTNLASNTNKLMGETPYDKATFDTCIEDLKKEDSFPTALSMLYQSKELRISYLNQAFADGSIEDFYHSYLIKTALIMTPEFKLTASNASEITKKNVDILEKRTEERRKKMHALLNQAQRENVIYQCLLKQHGEKQTSAIPTEDTLSCTPVAASCNSISGDAQRGPFNEEEIALVRSMLTQDREIAKNFFYQQMKEKNEAHNIIRMLCFCLEDIGDALSYTDSEQVQQIEQYRVFLKSHIATLVADTQPYIQAQQLYNLLKEFNPPQQSTKKRTKAHKPKSSKRVHIADLCS